MLELKGIKAEYENLKVDIDKAILDVLDSGNFIGGEVVTNFEKKLADYIGVKYCTSCGNATDALYMILKYLNIKEGDGIIVPSYTFVSTAEIVSLLGATPIFVDVCYDTFNLDADKLEEVILNVESENEIKLKGIIAVDLFGQQANYSKIIAIAKKHNLEIIEDAAQGFGGYSNSGQNGSFGIASAISFFPSKPLGCFGDGGAVLTNDSLLYKFIKSFKNHGKIKCKYNNEIIGINSRLDSIQASVLTVKLKHFTEDKLAYINILSDLYNTLLKNYVTTPYIVENTISSYAQYTIKLKNENERKNIVKNLMQYGIPHAIYYPIALHKQKAFKDTKIYANNLEMSEQLSKVSLSLPIHSYLTFENIEMICSIIRNSI